MVKQLKRFSGKKAKKTITTGVVHIKSTFNNTIVNITDPQGNTLFWASAGGSGFKGAKKGHSFCSTICCRKSC
jgi:small subunit ribosomal protein S11